MPVYRRSGSPYWWYSFTVSGRRFRGSTGRTSKREAEEVERDQHQLARRSLTLGSDWTLLAVLNTYWHERVKTMRSAPTIETHFAELQRGLGKELKTSRLTNGALMDYRARRRGRGVQHHSINREFAYLRAAYQHCHRFHGQALPAIEWKGLKAKEPPHRVRFLSREEYARLMTQAHPGIRPIIACAVATGLRQENILSLDWRQVKLEERVIQFKRMKSGKPFTIRISAALMAVLSVMPNRKGRVFDTTNFRRRWYKAVNDAELDDFRFHDLRHTFASWARQNGADLADIAEALDHSSISMTMRYAHIKPDEHRTAFDRVSDAVLAQSAAQDVPKLKAGNEKISD